MEVLKQSSQLADRERLWARVWGSGRIVKQRGRNIVLVEAGRRSFSVKPYITSPPVKKGKHVIDPATASETTQSFSQASFSCVLMAWWWPCRRQMWTLWWLHYESRVCVWPDSVKPFNSAALTLALREKPCADRTCSDYCSVRRLDLIRADTRLSDQLTLITAGIRFIDMQSIPSNTSVKCSGCQVML